MPKTRVVHCKREAYDVYIGRPGPWGNPFTIGKDGDRNQVIEKYRQWILQQPHLLSRLKELRGKVLGCWCKPLACNGDVLAQLADDTCPDCGGIKITCGHWPVQACYAS